MAILSGMDKIHLNQRMADFYGIKLPWDPNENSFAEMDAATLDRYGLHTHPTSWQAILS